MKPTTRAVLQLLRAYPDGVCRRVFAQHDIFEVAARIGELRADGFFIEGNLCKRHRHRSKLYSYRLTTDRI